jgi:hypothetical protein
MTSHPARLLCAGIDPGLLQTRCAVLQQGGYHAQPATVADVGILLRVQKFDLVIVSAWLDEGERGCILAAAGETPTLVLTELTPAEQLLAQVKRLLSRQDA